MIIKFTLRLAVKIKKKIDKDARSHETRGQKPEIVFSLGSMFSLCHAVGKRIVHQSNTVTFLPHGKKAVSGCLAYDIGTLAAPFFLCAETNRVEVSDSLASLYHNKRKFPKNPELLTSTRNVASLLCSY